MVDLVFVPFLFLEKAPEIRYFWAKVVWVVSFNEIRVTAGNHGKANVDIIYLILNYNLLLALCKAHGFGHSWHHGGLEKLVGNLFFIFSIVFAVRKSKYILCKHLLKKWSIFYKLVCIYRLWIQALQAGLDILLSACGDSRAWECCEEKEILGCNHL